MNSRSNLITSLRPKLRRRFAIAGVGASVLIWISRSVIWSAAPSAPDPFVLETAEIEQFRRNPTASTGLGELPTIALLKIEFPARMALQSTREVVLEYSNYIATGGDEVELRDGQNFFKPGKPRPGSPIARLRREMSARLDSSAFDTTNAIVTAMEDAVLPHTFRWTITPRRVGQHLVMLDLQDIIDSSTGSPLFGTTEVAIAGKIASLERGVQLPLAIMVFDEEKQFAWLWNTLNVIPALIGFVLTYPLFVEWLRRKLKRARPPKPARSASMEAGPESTI